MCLCRFVFVSGHLIIFSNYFLFCRFIFISPGCQSFEIMFQPSFSFTFSPFSKIKGETCIALTMNQNKLGISNKIKSNGKKI